jgi:hypothetical protein
MMDSEILEWDAKARLCSERDTDFLDGKESLKGKIGIALYGLGTTLYGEWVSTIAAHNALIQNGFDVKYADIRDSTSMIISANFLPGYGFKWDQCLPCNVPNSIGVSAYVCAISDANTNIVLHNPVDTSIYSLDPTDEALLIHIEKFKKTGQSYLRLLGLDEGKPSIVLHGRMTGVDDKASGLDDIVSLLDCSKYNFIFFSSKPDYATGSRIMNKGGKVTYLVDVAQFFDEMKAINMFIREYDPRFLSGEYLQKEDRRPVLWPFGFYGLSKETRLIGIHLGKNPRPFDTSISQLRTSMPLVTHGFVKRCKDYFVSDGTNEHLMPEEIINMPYMITNSNEHPSGVLAQSEYMRLAEIHAESIERIRGLSDEAYKTQVSRQFEYIERQFSYRSFSDKVRNLLYKINSGKLMPRNH